MLRTRFIVSRGTVVVLTCPMVSTASGRNSKPPTAFSRRRRTSGSTAMKEYKRTSLRDPVPGWPFGRNYKPLSGQRMQPCRSSGDRKLPWGSRELVPL